MMNYETKSIERQIMLYSPFLSDYNVMFDLINNLARSHSLLTSVREGVKVEKKCDNYRNLGRDPRAYCDNFKHIFYKLLAS